MEDRLRAAIARIDVVQGEKSLSRGTGTLVHERYLLTALHVVADRHQNPPAPYAGTIVLQFPGHRTEATIFEDRFDPAQDWVILECAEPPPALPVSMAELDSSGGEFTTFGFPDAQPVDGMVQTGTIESHKAELNQVAVFQLFSKQAAAGAGAPVKGLSGGPLLIDGALVGVLRFALMKEQRTEAGTLYACPVSAVLERCSDFLPIPDPVWGLPGLPRRDLPATPFRSLHYFEAQHAEIFFGRNREIRHLYDSVTDGEGPKLVLFYGQSGVGKSSFLAAGLEPRLDWSHDTIYLRREETTTPLDQIRSSLARFSTVVRDEGAPPPAAALLDPLAALHAARLRVDESIERSLEELDRLDLSAHGEASQELEGRLQTIRAEIEQRFEGLARTMRQRRPEPGPAVARPTEPEQPDSREAEPVASPETPRLGAAAVDSKEASTAPAPTASPPEPSAHGRSLVELWRATEEAAGRPLVVIFDQLEEVLIHPDAVRRRDLETLIEELRYVVSEASGVRGSVILSFRKEWLSEVLRVIERHDVPHAKAFLQGLDSDAIVEVVSGLTRTRRLRHHYGLRIDPGLPEKIAQDLSDDPDSPVAPALQILLTRMWKRATAASASEPVFSHELYRDLAREGLLLGNFLDQQLRKLGGAAHSGLALDLLAFHTTGRMTARERELKETLREYAHVADDVRRLVDDFRERRLLTEGAGDAAEPGPTTRLIHDTLARDILYRIDHSLLPGPVARRVLENRSVEWQHGKEGSLLDRQDLALVEAGRAGMRNLSDDEQRLVAASTAARDREDRIRRLLKSALGVATVLIVLFGISSCMERNEAVEARRTALALLARHEIYPPDLRLLLAVEATRMSWLQKRTLQLQSKLGHGPASWSSFEARTSLFYNFANAGWLETFMHGHTKLVWSLAFDSRGRLASAGGNRVFVWDLESRRPLATHTVDGGVALAVFLGDDGCLTAATDNETRLYSWTTEEGSGSCEPSLDQPADVSSVFDVAFRKDLTALAVGRTDGKVCLLVEGDTTPRCCREGDCHEGFVSQVAFDPVGGSIASAGRDGRVKLWRREGDDLVPHPTRTGQLEDAQHEAGARSVAFSPDGRLLVSGSGAGALRLFDVGTGQLLDTERTAHADPIQALAFALEETGPSRTEPRLRLASGSVAGSLRTWDLTGDAEVPQSNRLAGEFEMGRVIAGVWSLAFAPGGGKLATGSRDGKIRIWDLTLVPHIYKLSGPGWETRGFAFGRDGKTAVTGNLGGVGQAWPLPDGDQLIEELNHFAPGGEVLALDLTADSSLAVAAGSGAGAELQIVDLSSGEPQLRMKTGGEWIFDVDFVPREAAVVVSSQRGLGWLPVPGAGSRADPETTFGGCLTFESQPESEPNSWSWATADDGCTIERSEWELNNVRAASFSTDGEWFAWGKNLETRDASGESESLGLVCVCNTKEGTVTRLTDPGGNTSAPHEQVLSLAFAPLPYPPDAAPHLQRLYLASGGTEGVVHLWEVETRRHLRAFRGEADWIRAVAFGTWGDRTYLVSSGSDKTIWIREVPSGEDFVELLGHEGYIYELAFVPGERGYDELLSGADDRTLRRWHARLSSLDEARRTACELANRCLTESEWRLFIDSTGKYVPEASDRGFLASLFGSGRSSLCSEVLDCSQPPILTASSTSPSQ